MTTTYSALSAADLLDAVRRGDVVDLIAESVRRVFQELIEAEADARIGAARHERTDERVTYRNGSRAKLLTTQAGDVEVRIPKLRRGSFFPSILEPRRRIDQALHAVVMEAYVCGVSTRTVDDLAEALGASSGISKSEVSRICAGMDEFVDALRTRRLDHAEFPYVYLDATYLHVREQGLGQVVSKAVVIATGVRADGGREVLGLDVGDSEDQPFWEAFLASLKARGLSGVRLVVSDQHAGLVAALGRHLQGAAHQRCRVHFARNLLALFPKTHKGMAAAALRTAFAQPKAPMIADAWDKVRDQLAAVNPKTRPMMDSAKTEVLAFSAFPKEHWVKIWSNNPLERINKEIKRRSRVVGIFPNENAVIRLVGAILTDTHDEWQATDRRYLSEESMRKLHPNNRYDEPVATITGSDQHNQDS
ncbi:MAG: IS256 family transposase [Propionibacteriaceae bacterium]|nr:IS256 family transposase [Propionibacteriaceae bacterium]